MMTSTSQLWQYLYQKVKKKAQVSKFFSAFLEQENKKSTKIKPCNKNDLVKMMSHEHRDINKHTQYQQLKPSKPFRYSCNATESEPL